MGLETQSSLGIPIGMKSKQNINSDNGYDSKCISRIISHFGNDARTKIIGPYIVNSICNEGSMRGGGLLPLCESANVM
jgi:hypothetical protein